MDDRQTKLIKNAHIVTVNKSSDVFQGDILVEGNRISQIDKQIIRPDAVEIDAGGMIVIPGFVQTHIHLCQTLYRNFADDLALMDWLQLKVWPYEAGLTPETLRLSAQLGISELLMGGTTTIMDMGTVRHMDVVFEELERSGMRAFCGKTMMDFGNLPDGLSETTKNSIDESLALLDKWHNAAGGRIKYAFAPRFVISCSEELLTETAKLSRQYKIPFHTHASENRHEIELVHQRFDSRNIAVLEKLGVAGDNVCLAHCIWLDETEKQIMESHDMHVLHCPGSNLKLGSGIAPIPDYLERGISVSLGADGAPCNNNLDAFNEMKLAALIQKPLHGPKSMDAETVFRMATIEGACALHMEDEIGSIEVGKKADLCFLKSHQVSSIPYENIYSKIVYSMQSGAVRDVMIDGEWVVQDQKPVHYDLEKIIQKTNSLAGNFIN